MITDAERELRKLCGIPNSYFKFGVISDKERFHMVGKWLKAEGVFDPDTYEPFAQEAITRLTMYEDERRIFSGETTVFDRYEEPVFDCLAEDEEPEQSVCWVPPYEAYGTDPMPRLRQNAVFWWEWGGGRKRDKRERTVSTVSVGG